MTDPLPSITEIQNRAQRATQDFMEKAHAPEGDATEAREWSLAAKNAIAVVLAAEQTLRTRNSHQR